ncbi:hypothetical protein CC2G_002405 [Coprinopsis cinerea AmutBmut pab1-1]|nr:hypothetical protein CC2G_002405 [Coprinopsis cinerea AmutBmut pab1-1]
MPPSTSKTGDLESTLYRSCAQKLHFVGRAYFTQCLTVIRLCRGLISDSRFLRSLAMARKLKRLISESVRNAIDAASQTAVGHSRGKRADEAITAMIHELDGFLRVATPTSGLSRTLSVLCAPETMRRAREEDLKRAEKIGVLQARLIQSNAKARRKYLMERFDIMSSFHGSM